MKKRIFTLACVTAISLTTACIACSCGTNSSHARNDAYYREQMIPMPQSRTRDSSSPTENEISVPSESAPDSATPTPMPLPMPEPRPYFPGRPHRRRPIAPPIQNSAPECGDESCSEESDASDERESAGKKNPRRTAPEKNAEPTLN